MNVALDHSHDSPSPEALERHVSRASEALLAHQHADGHWCFELEADATIPAEYVLLRHFRGEPDNLELERLIAVYLRRIQGDHGGWPLVHAGPFDISASVKAYFALKMIGDDIDAPHMRRAREAILAHGGAASSNVFTRFLLALYGEIPWSGVPTMPVEIMLLPRWFPFHLDKISYWARTVLVPLLVLQALKPKPVNPRGVKIRELFVAPPETVRRWPTGAHQAWLGVKIFGGIDWLLKRAEPFFPAALRRRAIDAAKAFVTERLNGEDGLGAIYPAMANAVLMYDALGYPPDHPHLVAARRSIERLLVVGKDEAYCQPCLSPVWDTALAAHALMEAGDEASAAAARAGLDWLAPLQVLDRQGRLGRPAPEGAARRLGLPVRQSALSRSRRHRGRGDGDGPRGSRRPHPGARRPFASDRARARMDRRPAEPRRRLGRLRRRQYLLLSQPHPLRRSRRAARPADRRRHRPLRLAARAARRDAATSPTLARGIDALLKDQEKDGSWFGRWGMNYIYGTWSALCALAIAGEGAAIRAGPPRCRVARRHPERRRRLGRERRQLQPRSQGLRRLRRAPLRRRPGRCLGLMAAGEADHPAVARGVA